METVLNQDSLEPNQISLTSYNILADLYTDPWYFPYCNQQYLRFEYRRAKVVECISSLNSDIICLQEVDHYADYYEEQFQKLGYSCLFLSKLIREEGILTMFKKDKFIKIEDTSINFDKIIPEKLNAGHYQRNNNAQITCLKHISTNTKLIIANTHLFWNPQNEEVKLLQVAQVLESLTKSFKEDDNIFLCGDFNSMPTSNVFYYVTEKKEPHINRVELKFQQSIKVNDMKFIHNMYKNSNLLDLQSAYEDYQGTGKHPEFTNYTKNFKGTLDHIFYNPEMKNCQLIGISSLPIDQTKKEVGLPNKDFPSDHLPITAFFNIDNCTQKTDDNEQTATEQVKSLEEKSETEPPKKEAQNPKE